VLQKRSKGQPTPDWSMMLDRFAALAASSG
jgi:hypothetical protein